MARPRVVSLEPLDPRGPESADMTGEVVLCHLYHGIARSIRDYSSQRSFRPIQADESLRIVDVVDEAFVQDVAVRK